MKIHKQIYINGAWVDPIEATPIDVIHSTTEQVMGRIPGCSAQDADRAVKAARAALPAAVRPSTCSSVPTERS